MRIKEIVREEATIPAPIAANLAGNVWQGIKTAGTIGFKGLMTIPQVLDAIDRWKKGDRSGAVISILAAIGYIVPAQPEGFIVATGFDLLNYVRDHPEQFVRPEGRLTGKQAAQNMRQAQTGMDTPNNPDPRKYPEYYGIK